MPFPISQSLLLQKRERKKPPSNSAGNHGFRNLPGSDTCNTPPTCWSLPALWLWSNHLFLLLNLLHIFLTKTCLILILILMKMFFWGHAGGVLDMFAADSVGVHSWNHICDLCVSGIELETLLLISFFLSCHHGLFLFNVRWETLFVCF